MSCNEEAKKFVLGDGAVESCRASVSNIVHWAGGRVDGDIDSSLQDMCGDLLRRPFFFPGSDRFSLEHIFDG